MILLVALRAGHLGVLEKLLRLRRVMRRIGNNWFEDLGVLKKGVCM
jgi:hypothetical protein